MRYWTNSISITVDVRCNLYTHQVVSTHDLMCIKVKPRMKLWRRSFLLLLLNISYAAIPHGRREVSTLSWDDNWRLGAVCCSVRGLLRADSLLFWLQKPAWRLVQIAVGRGGCFLHVYYFMTNCFLAAFLVHILFSAFFYLVPQLNACLFLQCGDDELCKLNFTVSVQILS